VVRVGLLVPSSNTVLEPMAAKIVASLDGVTVHFSRFPVVEISLEQPALSQFATAPMLQAARLLADAHIDVIAWAGASASWLGLDADRSLAKDLKRATGAPASTCVLSMVGLMRSSGATTYGLVSPYVDDVQAKIIETLALEGFECTSERHFQYHENFAFGLIKKDQLSAAIRSVAGSRPDVILVPCTNLATADIAADLEKATGIAIMDAVSATIWGALNAVSPGFADMSQWGTLFSTR
jgi:maleate isomerase